MSPTPALGFGFLGELGPGSREERLKVNGELQNSSGPPKQVVWRKNMFPSFIPQKQERAAARCCRLLRFKMGRAP